MDWIDIHGDAAEPDDLRLELEALPTSIDSVVYDAEQFRPFPVDALPEPIRGFVTAGSKAIGCDPSYLALPLMTELAAAIGSTRRLELKRGWSAPAIIWSAIVGESGTAKTPAFKLVMRPIRERQRKALDRHAETMKRFEADLARWEKEACGLEKRQEDFGRPASEAGSAIGRPVHRQRYHGRSPGADPVAEPAWIVVGARRIGRLDWIVRPLRWWKEERTRRTGFRCTMPRVSSWTARPGFRARFMFPKQQLA